MGGITSALVEWALVAAVIGASVGGVVVWLTYRSGKRRLRRLRRLRTRWNLEDRNG